MGHLLKFVLDVHLKVQDLVCKVGMVDLVSHFGGLLVHACLKEALGVVDPVLDHVGVEFGELVVQVGSGAIVLNVELAVCHQGKSCAVHWRELQFVCEDSNHL